MYKCKICWPFVVDHYNRADDLVLRIYIDIELPFEPRDQWIHIGNEFDTYYDIKIESAEYGLFDSIWYIFAKDHSCGSVERAHNNATEITMYLEGKGIPVRKQIFIPMGSTNASISKAKPILTRFKHMLSRAEPPKEEEATT